MASPNGSASIPAQTTTTTPYNTASGSFPGLRKELSGLLQVHDVPNTGQLPRKLLVTGDPTKPYLPGQPRIRLPTRAPAASAIQTQEELKAYLEKSHLTTELDGILPFMKYVFVSLSTLAHLSCMGYGNFPGSEPRVYSLKRRPDKLRGLSGPDAIA